jgi:hypothetical protein
MDARRSGGEGAFSSGFDRASLARPQGRLRVDGLELAAVDRNARFAEQLKPSAQHHELTADLADGLAIVFPEVGYGLEVRHQATGQPNQLDVALALPFQAPARLHPIEVSVDVIFNNVPGW